jgi:predicted dehydrogenase
MEKVRFGIIGAGNMGTDYFKYFMGNKIQNGECVAIADLAPDKLENIKKIGAEMNPEATKKVSYYASGDELIEANCCDAVIIAVPHYFHPVFAIKAMQNGLHAVVEKPAGVYTLQVEEMLQEAEKHSELKLGMMFNVRTHPFFRKMKQVIDEGALGRITRLNWIVTRWFRSQYYYDSGSWRATWKGEGGGVLYNQAPHQIDLFQWVPSMMPNRVQAHCRFGQWHDIEVEDDVTAYFEYPNGATGVFITTTGESPGTDRFEIVGEYGKLVYENWKLTFYKNEVSTLDYINNAKDDFSSPKYEVIDLEGIGEYTGHCGILNNFVNAVLGKEELFCPATDGLNGVILANAMLLSQWTNGLVDIPFDSRKFYDLLQQHIAESSTIKKDTAAGAVANLSGTFVK